MDCTEFEKLLLERGSESLGNAMPVAEHRSRCVKCRETEQRWEQLDAELSRTVRVPQLPKDFKARIMERAREQARWSPRELAERRRKLEAEYQAGLARIRPIPMPSQKLVVAWIYAALFSLAGWLALEALPENGSSLISSEMDRGALTLWISLLLAGFGVLFAMFPRVLRQLSSMH